MKEYLKKNLFMVLALLLSIVLTVGSVSFISACGPKEDGTWMMCHYAQLMITLSGIMLVLFNAGGLFLPRKLGAKNGLSMAAIIVAVSCIFIPHNMIPLCMMHTMRCHTLMRPAAIVLCCLIAVAEAVSLFQGRE